MLLFDTIKTVSPWQDWLENLSVIQAGSKDLLRLQEAISSTHTVGIDLETTGLDPYLSDICLIQLAAGNIKTLSDNAECFLFQPSKPVLAYLIGLVESPDVTKIFCNAKFDLEMLQGKCDRRLMPRNVFDVMLASQIVTAGDFIPERQFEKYCRENGIVSVKQGSMKYYDSHGHEIKFSKDTAKATRPVYRSHSLQQIAHRHLEIWLDKELQVSDWSHTLTQDQLKYAAWDAAVLLPLYSILQELAARNKLENTVQIEMNCLPAVIEIELSGMPFKREQAKKLLAETEADLAEAQRRLELANPNSSGQVTGKITSLGREFLRGNELVIQGETFELSSGDEILSRIKARLPEDHPLSVFIENIQQYRHLKKKADMLKKWLESVHPHTGRLHPDLVQINPQGVGRFSAREPNLQQVGRDKALRELFAAPPGRKLVICDYSGIEMRIMAELSKDKTLIKAFKDGIDIHRFTASRISGKPLDEVTKEERQLSKAVNFGLIYGMAANTLQQYTEIGYGVTMAPEQASASREGFFKTYPGIERWHHQQSSLVAAKNFKDYWVHDFNSGYCRQKRPLVRTLGGRLRVWPTEQAKSGLKKVGPVTELYNAPDQGTGADMIKVAMSYVYQELAKPEWKDTMLIACIHDELILETPEEKAEQAREMLLEQMLKAAGKLLPYVSVEAEAEITDSWAEK